MNQVTYNMTLEDIQKEFPRLINEQHQQIITELSQNQTYYQRLVYNAALKAIFNVEK